MNNVGIHLRGLGWDGRRCGTVENLVKFSEDLGGFGGGDGRGRDSKSWSNAVDVESGEALW